MDYEHRYLTHAEYLAGLPSYRRVLHRVFRDGLYHGVWEPLFGHIPDDISSAGRDLRRALGIHRRHR